LCDNSPCGPYAHCEVVGNHIKCSCLPNCIGSPPFCRLECQINSDCPLTKACDQNNRCIDPCIGSCARNADCRVVSHSPVCTCPSGHTGDPFNHCELERIPIEHDNAPQDPCIPTPCGPNSRCDNYNGFAKCSCLPNYYGRAPNCRPECILNSECNSDQSCINNVCRDSCEGACGVGALCQTVNHYPICSCPSHLRGDPQVQCDTKPDCKTTFLESLNLTQQLHIKNLKPLTKVIQIFSLLTS
jgi:hypothetical protein